MPNDLPGITCRLLAEVEQGAIRDREQFGGCTVTTVDCDVALALVREVRRLRKMAAFLNFSHDSNCSIDATGKCDCGYFDFLFDRNRN